MKKTFTLILLLALAFALQAQTIEHVYHFNQPTVSERDGYQQIGFQDCRPSGIVGEPTLPWHSISLLLPEGMEAGSVEIEFLDFKEMEGTYLLYPYQAPRPYSYEGTIPFAKNEELYQSEEVYPASATRALQEGGTQFLNGVGVAFNTFTPVRYIPATGKVSYAQTVRVRLNTQESRADHSRKLWLTPENEASIRRLVQNPEMLNSYDKRGREIGGYDMLVITAEEWIPSFADYLELYNNKGIRTRIVSLEEIYASMEGRDPQEQIRNYIIQEYEDNGIQMVSLGGDVSIVPFRYLWCWAQEGEEDQLPADMYYACLDGTLNDDDDDRWGEVGEDDLLPEIGIGRLPFNNETQFQTIMHKTFSYLQKPVLGEFTSPILGAEHLGDGYFGSVDMERLIGENNDYDYTTYGYPEDYNFKRYYASPTMNWGGNPFRDLIGSGGQYVHHVGHANDDYVAGWTGSMMGNNFFPGNDGIHHNYQIFHSHGCICGNFTVNCVLEKMVTIETGFVVTTGNSRYGWYVPWGDGMAAHIHREFIDAYCHDLIPTIGMALREAKIATAPWVTMFGEEGCMRWNIYCLNVLGDVALYPWFEEPVRPDVIYPNGIMQGTSAIDVDVCSTGGTSRHFENFTVSLFKGEQLLARGVTASSGTVTLYPNNPEELVGDMELVVTGQSAWPQRLPVRGFTAEEPYLYANLGTYHEDGNGLLEPGETVRVSLSIENPSNIGLSDVEVTLSSEDDQITFTNNHVVIPSIEANSTYPTSYLDPEGCFTFVVSDEAVDLSHLLIDVEITAEGHTWHSQIPAHLSAPILEYTDFEADDSQGDQNGLVDPGELITLHVRGKNIGHATAHDAYLTITCDDEGIYLQENRVEIGDIEEDGSFTADIAYTTADNIIGGSIFHFNLELHSGAYTTTYDYIFSVGFTVETFESGDFTAIEWEHSGSQPWFVTDEEAHSGTFSARSGAISHSQATTLFIYADILLDGEISFWFKTSSELRKDLLAFYIDNTKMEWWSGETDWTYASFSFEAGSHVFKWHYQKSNTNSVGSDCAWIDDITLPHTCIITDVKETVTDVTNQLYPNPTKGSFTIELAAESDISIFNMLGQNIMHLSQVSYSQQIHLSEAGVYFVRISNANGVEVKKVVVE